MEIILIILSVLEFGYFIYKKISEDSISFIFIIIFNFATVVLVIWLSKITESIKIASTGTFWMVIFVYFIFITFSGIIILVLHETLSLYDYVTSPLYWLITVLYTIIFYYFITKFINISIESLNIEKIFIVILFFLLREIIHSVFSFLINNNSE